MLEPMTMPSQHDQRGFTMIELMTVVVIASVLLALAIPSFREVLARNRLEAVAGELATDLQFARSEAVSRNRNVGLIAQANCYTVFVVGSTPASNCTTFGTGGSAIKSVIIDTATISLGFTPSVVGRPFIQFDPVRGLANDVNGADWSGYVEVNTSVGTWPLRADVTNFGRARACSPLGAFKGYPTC
jgi:type IV fimbrial biogenesis protein FimT